MVQRAHIILADLDYDTKMKLMDTLLTITEGKVSAVFDGVLMYRSLWKSPEQDWCLNWPIFVSLKAK